MKVRSFISLVVLLCCCQNIYAQGGAKSVLISNLPTDKTDIQNQIIISLTLPVESVKNTSELYWRPAFVPLNGTYEYVKLDEKQTSGNKTTWIINSSDAIVIQPNDLPQTNFHLLVEAGDSISINIDANNKAVATGKGAEKINLAIELSKLYEKGKRTTSELLAPPVSLEDYRNWDKYFDNRTALLVDRINASKGKLSFFAYDFILTYTIQHIEHYRLMKVANTISFSNKNLLKVLTNEDRCKIFDTALHKPTAQWLRTQPENSGDVAGMFMYIDKKIDRNLQYDTAAMAALSNDWPLYYRTMLEEGTKVYHGDALKSFAAYTIGHAIKYHHGDSEVEKLILKFYETEKDSTFSEFVKRKELGARFRSMRPGQPLPNFTLVDAKDKRFDQSLIDGKMAIISFWDPKIELPTQSLLLNQLRSEFNSDIDICFVTVLATTDRKLGNEIEKQYLAPNEFLLYTDKEPTMENPYPATVTFNVKKYPSIFLVNSNGNILMSPDVNKAPDKPEYLVGIMKKAISEKQDGPYILLENDLKKAYYLNNGKVTSTEVRAENELSAQTDLEKRFTFLLAKKMTIPESVYPASEKILAFSDIEGNFDALRKLLQSNKIIDDNFDWIFGNGHLVFAGDMFDRGNQVTECLWLLYSLEEKAQKAGGYVHFVLGNHEIMNLQGNHRYVTEKYNESAGLLGKTLTQLYAENSELGRWLRTKNIVEKIGNLLFMHGGISSELNQSDLTIQQINDLARPHYAENKPDYGNIKVNTIMSSRFGPFWFRGYYQQKIDETVVDRTLTQFDVKHIVTGHTMVSSRFITVHYNNKVINTDTKHKEGKSEALLVEGNNFYRVNADGNKELLFKDGDIQYNKK